MDLTLPMSTLGISIFHTEDTMESKALVTTEVEYLLMVVKSIDSKVLRKFLLQPVKFS